MSSSGRRLAEDHFMLDIGLPQVSPQRPVRCFMHLTVNKLNSISIVPLTITGGNQHAQWDDRDNGKKILI